MKLTLLPLTLLAITIPATSAHAHFLWGGFTSGATPEYRLTISETPIDYTDDDHATPLKGATAWTPGGKDLKLTWKDGFQTSPYSANTKLIAAGYSWGVFPKVDKTKKTPAPNYLLDLYAKAATTEAAASQTASLPLEVFARRSGKGFVATVKSYDKPLAGAEVVVVTPNAEKEKTFKTDKNGTIRFAYTTPGLYTVRAIDVWLPRFGAHNGKRFSLVNIYSTLSFPVK